MNKNEVKKDLYKSRVMAEFSHYTAGNLYYNVKVGLDIYQFPIATVETDNSGGGSLSNMGEMRLSSDLGTTSFGREVKGSSLIRWIDMAIDNNEFIMVEPAVAPI